MFDSTKEAAERLLSLRNSSAIGLALCAVGAVIPATAGQQAPVQLPAVSVEDTAQQYKPEVVESPKYTAPLLDTPQTVTVIPEAVIKDQNLMSLRDVLSTVPGITFGAGEGGGGYGDSVNLRGFSANTDITIDGVRDSAQYTRSDPFNLEQIEIVNGANSVYGGSGSIGGGINIVSKVAKDTNFTNLSGGIGTDNYFRGTVDTNQSITETSAIRLNLMGHKNDVPGRDVEQNKRWGIAPSIALGLGTPTRFTFSFIHQYDSNVPQYGVPYFRNAYNDGPLLGAQSSNYYGYANMDVQRSNLDAGTAIITHDFDQTLSVRNLTRYQQVTQFSLVNPTQGTWCLASGINVSTGAACATPGQYQPSGPRGTTRATKNTNFYNQTDLMAKFTTGSVRHSAVLGVGVSSENFRLDNGNSQRTAAGATPTYPLMSIASPDNIYTGPQNYVQAAAQDGTMRNQSIYLFETAELSPQFEINGGLRYEHNEGTHTTATYANGVFSSQGELFKNEDYLFSYRVGLVYKPIQDASIYVAYGNSKAPSKTSVNGSCTAATCSVSPETARNYEIGAKWNLLENQLSLTGAIFRNARTNFRVNSGDPIVTEQQLDGSARVDGIALGAAGTITPQWMIFTNYTYLKSKYQRSVSDFCFVNPGVGDCTNAPGQPDPLAGRPLSDVPKHALSLWTTYTLPFDVTVGYGATYEGKFTLRRGSDTVFQQSETYWVHRAMVSYAVTDKLNLQLNVNNLFDKEYYLRIRNNGWATPGDARSATLTVNYNL
jgi:catecholate siderophore receptor